MKAYRSRLARVLDPASNLPPALPLCPAAGLAQMIPDVAIHDPWPKDGEAAEEHMAFASHSRGEKARVPTRTIRLADRMEKA